MNKTPQRKLDASARQRAKINADPEKLAKKREYMRNYGKQNREKLNELGNELYRKKRAYIQLQRKGVEPTEDLVRYIEDHCGKCDICGVDGDGRWKILSIDHCHKTNQFRGMLCNNCNHGLGKFKDDIELLQKAMDYLIQYRKTLPNEYVPG